MQKTVLAVFRTCDVGGPVLRRGLVGDCRPRNFGCDSSILDCHGMTRNSSAYCPHGFKIGYFPTN